MDDFDAAVYFIANYRPDSASVSNDLKLQFYGLYKQAIEGPCRKPAPGMFDLVGSKKYASWIQHGDMTQQEAKSAYVQLLDKMEPNWRAWDGVHDLLDAATDSVSATPNSISDAIQQSICHTTAADIPATTPSAASDAGIYDDFTATRSSQRPTPTTVNQSILQRIMTPARAFATRFMPQSDQTSQSLHSTPDIRVPQFTTAPTIDFTTTPGSMRSTFVPSTNTRGIRWSFSPNATTHSALQQQIAHTHTPQSHQRSVAHTAENLERRLSKLQLAQLCADLQLQVAQYRLRLQSSQDALQFYVATLHGMSSSQQMAGERERTPNPPHVLVDALLTAQRFISAVYNNMQYRKKIYVMIAILGLLLYLRLRSATR